MKKIINLLFTLILLCCFNVYADTSETVSDPDVDLINQPINKFMEENQIQGVAVEVYLDGKSHSYYYGYADQNKKKPVSKNTIFEIGCISKIMIGILLAQQVDAATIQLDDSLKKYLPELPDSYDHMTLKTLATNTSGLPFDVPNSIKTRDELNKYLNEWTSENKPGEQWIYSNFGIGMLGYALETMTHKNFNELYRNRILSPLGMQPLGLTVPERFKSHYAQGFDKGGKPVEPMELGLFSTAYGLKASAYDMQRFLRAAIGLPGTPSQIFYPIRLTQTAFVRLPNQKQGLVWRIYPITSKNVSTLMNDIDADVPKSISVNEIYERPRFNMDTLIDKTGMTNGFRSYIAVIPMLKSGVVILANKSVSDNSIVKTGREILFKLTKLMDKDNK